MPALEVEVTGVSHGDWLERPVLLLYRLGLRRLALAIAERFVYVDVYANGRYVFTVELRRKDDA